MAERYQYVCGCGKRLVLKESYVGKSGKCSCGAKIHITRDLLNSLSAAQKTSSSSGSHPPKPTDTAQKPSASVSTEDIPLEWNVGDVILDLYEVLPVTVGYGEDAEEKGFHEGGMGRIYRVRHMGWNRELAVKCPRAQAFKKQSQKDNFIGECESWMELGLHPHIASCFYVRDLGGIPRIFAEYVDGGSLKDWIEHGKLYEGEDEQRVLARMLDIAIQFAWGLHFAHEKGMIHQDVKPHNVMLTSDSIAKVVDFGLSRAKDIAGLNLGADHGQSIMVTHAGGYTPAYCSPEQVNREKLTRRTDLWSWALSVLEMFTGGISWQSGMAAGQALEVFLEHNGEDEEIPAMPDGVVDLLSQCFQHDESQRPRSMLECAEQLAAVYEQEAGNEYPREMPKASELLADGLNNQGVSYYELGRTDDAREMFKKALTYDPHHVEATYNGGLLQWRSGEIDDRILIRRLQDLRSSHQSNWIDEYVLAMVFMESGDCESVIQVLSEIPSDLRNKKEIAQLQMLAERDLQKSVRIVARIETSSNSRASAH